MPKRKCHFNDELQKKFPMFKAAKIGNEVFCPTCNSTFSIANKGKSDLEQHLNTQKHQQKIRAAGGAGCSKVTDFFVERFSKQEELISATEGALAFHTIKHNFSFRSTDCTTKLLKKILPDSEIAKKISSARTKTEAIITGVLAPHTLKMLKTEAEKCNYLGICTDASNHKDLKMFPILIQFFDQKTGINVNVLKVSSLKDEKSDTIVNYLYETLESNGLLNNCIAFSGDNCNTNFGGVKRAGTKNVFKGLSEKLKKSIVGIGCPAHILNNTVQHGCDSLPVDIDSLILKIYNHFSIYTLRVEKLKEFCEFVEIKYKKLLFHSKTRWLSLFPCINRILEVYEGLTSYFLSEPAAPVTLKLFFEDGLNEAYLWFIHSLMYIFNENIKTIEREENSLLEVMECLSMVKKNLEERIKEKFLPLKVKAIFRRQTEEGKDTQVQVMKKNFLFMYEKCLSYLNLWTSSLKEFENFLWMSLKDIPLWETVQESILFCQTYGVILNEDKLFNQYCNLKSFLESSLTDDEFCGLSSSQKWCQYFKAVPLEDCNGEFLKLCQFFFSIPPHNANAERSFSLINYHWTDERNRFDLSTIESIMLIHFNLKHFSCDEFYAYILTQKDVLRKISSSEKYK